MTEHKHGPRSAGFEADILVDAFDTLYAALDEHTLADLVEKPRALTQVLIRH